MTTPPDHIWLARAWADTFQDPDTRENVAPYVRRDPAVLAELPEVQALRDALEEADRQLAYLDEKMPTGTTPAVRARIAAAIREGRG